MGFNLAFKWVNYVTASKHSLKKHVSCKERPASYMLRF